MHFATEGFEPVAPKFPERIGVQLPKGARSAIRRAAEQEKTSPAEFVRKCIIETVCRYERPLGRVSA
jgi:hypothetical protein